MHAKKIVDEALGNCLSSLHAKLAVTVKAAVCGVLQGGEPMEGCCQSSQGHGES